MGLELLSPSPVLSCSSYESQDMTPISTSRAERHMPFHFHHAIALLLVVLMPVIAIAEIIFAFVFAAGMVGR